MQVSHKSSSRSCKINTLYNLYIIYIYNSVIVVPSNPCIEPSPRTNKSFFLLPTCKEKLLSTPKITSFLLQLPSDHKNCESASNPIL